MYKGVIDIPINDNDKKTITDYRQSIYKLIFDQIHIMT